MKKKLIDKLLKMRQDNEDNPLGRKLGKGGLGELQTNTKLLVEGLTQNTPTQLLQSLFEAYPGFKDVNHIINKQLAFIEFETDEMAGPAMNVLNNYMFKDPQNAEQVTLRTFPYTHLTPPTNLHGSNSRGWGSF